MSAQVELQQLEKKFGIEHRQWQTQGAAELDWARRRWELVMRSTRVVIGTEVRIEFQGKAQLLSGQRACRHAFANLFQEAIQQK